MSSTLQSYIHPNLKSEIESKLSAAFGGDFEGEANPRLSQYAGAISEAVSKIVAQSVQQYLNNDVRVLPGQATVGGPTAQATVSPGLLTAP